MTTVDTQNEAVSLKSRWLALRNQEPMLRARDAAEKLRVSERELVAARCGDGVRRLTGPWGEFIKSLPGLGTVMSLTRNESVVHEKVGAFDKISIMGRMGLVLNDDIDLRLFMDHWQAGFAVSEDTRSGLRHSLQFFDGDGIAIYKLYLRDESNHEAYEALVTRHLHQDQGENEDAAPRAEPAEIAPDAAIDKDLLRTRWAALQDVHDFHALLHDVGVGRVQALRLAGTDWAYRVDPSAFRAALTAAAETELPIMIFAGSPGVIQIHTGPVSNLKAMGPWYNVLDPGFNLHLREDRIATAWVVKKPTKDGVVTSLEIYDSDSGQIAWMFGKRKEGQSERAEWREVVNSLPALKEQR